MSQRDHVELAEEDLRVGMGLHDRGDYEHALSHFRRAAVAFNSHGLEERLADCRFNQGMSFSALKKFDEAETEYSASIEYFEDHGFIPKAAFAHNNQANAHQRALRGGDAIRSYLAARDHFDSAGMTDDARGCDAGVGNIHRDLLESAEAARCYEIALAGFSPQAHGEIADARHNLGLVLHQLGEQARAKILFGQARAYYIEQGIDAKVAFGDIGLGLVESAQRRHKRALAHYTRAKYYFENFGNSIERANVIVLVAKSLLATYDAEGAILEYTIALNLYREDPGQSNAAATCKMALGNAYLRKSDFVAAKACYEGSLAYFQAAGKRAEEADCEFNIGNLHLSTKSVKAAEAAYARAGNYYKAESRSKDSGDFFRALFMAYWSRGDYDKAGDQLAKARAVFESLGLPDEVALCDFDESALLHELNDNAGAYTALLRAREHYETTDDSRSLALCDGRAGVILGGLGHHRGALNASTAARDYAEAVNDSADVAKYEINRSNALSALGNLDDAEHALARAKVLLEKAGLRSDIPTCDVNLGLLYEKRAQSEPDVGLGRYWLRSALALLIPASLFLDAGRFGLSTSRERQLWTRNKSSAVFAIALRIAEALEDADVIAAMVLDARANGTYASESADDGSVVDFNEISYESFEDAPRKPETHPALTASSALCRVLGSEDWQLDPSPLVELPSGWIALDEQVSRAEEVYGKAVRAESLVRAYG